MRDETFLSETPVSYPDSAEPSGAIKRALYLWERKPPSETREGLKAFSPSDPNPSEPENLPLEDQFKSPPWATIAPDTAPVDEAIEDSLKRHASRLAALEQVIPGDRRLDPPRFSLMMLNAFLGRAVSDGAVLARLPGLFSISDRIDTELADLELEYPAALEASRSEPDPTPVLLRDEMRSLFHELKSMQKAQQRQLVASLSALHSSISEMRSHWPEPHDGRKHAGPESNSEPGVKIDEIAKPLIDTERLVDPRPVLAAARAAASRAKTEIVTSGSVSEQPKAELGRDQRSYRSILLGSAFLGILMIVFGRDAVQFLSASNMHPVAAQP